MKLHNLGVSLGENGVGCKITLDGKPLHGCYAIEIRGSVDNLPRATLFLYANVNGEVVGKVDGLPEGAVEELLA